MLPPDSTLDEKRVIPIEEFQGDGGAVLASSAVKGSLGDVIEIPHSLQAQCEGNGPTSACEPGEHELVEKIHVLNDAVGLLVVNDIVDEAAAYRFLAGKLTELLDA
ncbi:hypothetical protein [Halorarum salinum]|uniref:Uncharacterized protein n=1 Tax=Halorarum salinum TaxID=2743089 RepID=A0A7D5LBB1_9EURY|nr:hypothetical protein [Halobaculum salinum]QLG61909.1 hypothetical protein HUG12_09325 [Halobaculum salinum]